MWSVILFVKDNSVEAVPSHWYINGQCFWPKKSVNCKKLLERRSMPNPVEYNLFAARSLCTNISKLTLYIGIIFYNLDCSIFIKQCAHLLIKKLEIRSFLN